MVHNKSVKRLKKIGGKKVLIKSSRGKVISKKMASAKKKSLSVKQPLKTKKTSQAKLQSSRKSKDSSLKTAHGKIAEKMALKKKIGGSLKGTLKPKIILGKGQKKTSMAFDSATPKIVGQKRVTKINRSEVGASRALKLPEISKRFLKTSPATESSAKRLSKAVNKEALFKKPLSRVFSTRSKLSTRGKAPGSDVGVDIDLDTDEAEATSSMTDVDRLLDLGKEKGYLTVEDLHEALDGEAVSEEQLEEAMSMFGEHDIDIVAGEDSKFESEGSFPAMRDEDVETVAIGKSTDPVRMYLREMGNVSLLTREGEVEIAKKIESGLKT
ncbi:MAG: hypothetical protein GYA55_11905, partial [SAR324 cluster bacterium]|nr:hypothetical protein [SAR324 cluster bacterium]